MNIKQKQHMLMSSKRARGFTLLEILVVMLILGIAAGFSYNAYGEYRKKSEAMEIVTKYHQLKTLVSNYYIDHGKFPSNQMRVDERQKQIGLEDRYGGSKSDVIANGWFGSNGIIGKESTSGHILFHLKAEKQYLLRPGGYRFVSTVEATPNGLVWVCNNTGPEAQWPSGIAYKYMPKECRN